MTTKHYKYGGSTAARTMGCAAWQDLSKQMPTKRAQHNPAADQGTLLHNCMEEFMMKDCSFMAQLEQGRNYNDQQLNAEHVVDKLRPALEALQQLESDHHLIEFDCEPLVKFDDEIGGSIDYIGVSKDGKTVVLVDYKFGFVPVRAEDNKQMMFYAMCASTDPTTADMFDNCDTLILAVIQPNDNGAVLDSVSVPYADLPAFIKQHDQAVKRSSEADSEPTSGSWCNYCPAEAICPVKTGKALQALQINELTAQALATALPMVAELESWIKTIKKTAHEQLELGVPIDGYKLVNKRASRVWNDTDSVREKIKLAKKIKLDDGFDVKLKSPAQLEKVCKTLGVDFKAYSKFISAVSSGTTLAPVSDKRPAALPLVGLKELNDMMAKS